MYGLIQTVFTDAQQSAFEKIYSESEIDDQFLLRASLAQALKDSSKIIPSNGTDWILCTLTQFKKDPEETLRVFQGIMKCFEHIEFGILTNKYEWKDINSIADDSLIGVSFFRKYIERLNKHRAAPSIEYYINSGKLAFRRLGFDGIADDFIRWTEFLENEFM